MSSVVPSKPIKGRRTQIISSNYTNPGFRLLLDEFFGKGEYTLYWRRDHYEIAADRKLTEQEKEKLRLHYKTSAPNSAVEDIEVQNEGSVHAATNEDAVDQREESSGAATDEDIEAQKLDSARSGKNDDKREQSRGKQPAAGLKKFLKGFLNSSKGPGK